MAAKIVTKLGIAIAVNEWLKACFSPNNDP